MSEPRKSRTKREPKPPRTGWQLGEPLPAVMEVPEAALFLGVTRQTVYSMIDAGEIQGSRKSGKGRPRRVWTASVVAWVQGQQAPTKRAG